MKTHLEVKVPNVDVTVVIESQRVSAGDVACFVQRYDTEGGYIVRGEHGAPVQKEPVPYDDALRAAMEYVEREASFKAFQRAAVQAFADYRVRGVS